MAEENIEGQGLYAEEKKPAALNPLYAKIVEHVCAAISIVLDFICFFVGIILFVLMMYSGQIFSNPINENCSKTNIQQYLVVMSVCHFIQCAVSTISLLIFLFGMFFCFFLLSCMLNVILFSHVNSIHSTTV